MKNDHRASIILSTMLALTTLLPLSVRSDVPPAATMGADAAPPTVPITSLSAPNAASSLPFKDYRLFIESLQLSGQLGGTGDQFSSAELTFNTSAGAQPLLIGPDWRAKTIAVRPHQVVDYGTSYYFPVGSPSAAQRIEGKIMLTARGAGLINAPKVLESFTVAFDRAAITGTREVELTGDGGSHLRVRLYSPCDFNIYETLDISGISRAIHDELSKAGARVFSESGGGAPYSRSANAIWIGADVPQECAALAMRVFSTDHGIPLKGVFTFTDNDRGRYFFNPGSITLGHSDELTSKPELPKARLTQLFGAAGKHGG